MSCPDPAVTVEARIDRVLTQYRESPNLLHLARTYLEQVEAVEQFACLMPEKFDLVNAVGDQLTLLGKRMGWPRCHCVCNIEPVFGFACADDVYFRPVVGFCDPNSSWDACSSGISDICLNDDDLYRKFLLVRRHQYTNQYDFASLEAAVRIFFGEDAGVLHSGQGRAVVTPGRALTQVETSLLQLYVRVLPVALGIKVTFHFGIRRVFGFGEGWGGFMEEDTAVTEASDAFQRTGMLFGFCEDADNQIGGFCESWVDGDGLPFVTGQLDLDGSEISITVDDEGTELYSGPLTEDAAWVCRTNAPRMCEINIQPYDC